MTIGDAKTYAGRSAAERAASRRERLLDAGLDLMGTVGLERTTVRGVIARSGVAPRYFYESFPGLDELQLAVFERITDEVEEHALAALDQAGRGSRARIRAVLGVLVSLLLGDPRKGRVVLVEALGSPVLGARRLAEARRFADLLVAHSAGAWRDGRPTPRGVVVTAQFGVGGLAETLALVLSGELKVEREVLVDDLTELFAGLRPSLRRITVNDP